MRIDCGILFSERLLSLFGCPFDRLIKLHRKVPRNVDYPQFRPLVAVAFNISTAENGSNEFGCATTLVLIATSGEDFVTPNGGNDERFVATRLNTIVDRDVPLAQRCADGFDFALDGGFDGRKDHPTLFGGEGAGGGVLAEKAHLPTAQGQSPPRRQTTTAQQHPRPHERQILPRVCRLCVKIGMLRRNKKHTTVNRPWHGPRPRSAPRCCGRNGRCARFVAWVRPRPRGR